MTITTFQMLWNEISPLVSQVIPSHRANSHDFFDAWRNLFGKCVSIVVYAHFFLSDKKCILLKCAHKFCMRIFRIYAHLGISIQSFFYAIFQNAHKKGGWKRIAKFKVFMTEAEFQHQWK